MIAYHYTSGETIPTGSTITSEQSSGSSKPYYDIVWPIYKKVADELGKYFPTEFGYAYPAKRSHMEHDPLVVEAPDDCVTAGNFSHSVYVTIDICGNGGMNDKSLPLQQRLENRKRLIEAQAREYFDVKDPSDPERVELISDRWTVV